MKKIMFNDKYGLTKAVLEGRKTMTRRSISEDVWERADVYRHEYYEDTLDLLPAKKALIEFSPFKVGEVVAVAQRYKDTWGNPDFLFAHKPGWNNKMFVSADLMPHQIRITSVRIERLQDISDEDCLREGVRKLESENCPTMFTFDGWSFKNKVNRCTDSPKEAFEALFKKLSGKKAWDDNPWVFVYEFELVK